MFVGGAAAWLAGCGARLRGFPFDRGSSPIPGLKNLEVTYYSVGCFLVQLGDVALLTDPFWSHVPLSEVIFSPMKHDLEEINAHRKDLKNVSMVVVGHGHYDHCFDLDQICDDLHPKATIYGSQTLVHTFASSALSRPLVAVNDARATPDRPGHWFYNHDRSLRFLPIASGHPNQYLFLHLYQERLQRARQGPPSRASDYQEGETIAFLVDFMKGDAIEARVYVQTSSTGYPAGFAPPEIFAERRVDVALLPMDCANLKMAGASPNIVDTLAPKTVLFCHWEDFFAPKSGVPREIVKVDLPAAKAFFRSTPQTRYLFPYWNSRFLMPV